MRTIHPIAICLLNFFIVSHALCQAPASAELRIHPAITDSLFAAHSVSLEGRLSEELDASYQHRILAQDFHRLVAPFRNRTETSCWQSEFWGKWFTSAVLAYRYRPESPLKAILDSAVSELIATQTPDGYIGNYQESSRLQNWDIWGRKYCLLGLLSYYDLTGNKNSLDAARKLADGLIKELADKKAVLVKLGSHRGMAVSSILEPVCLLYTRTGEPRYLAFAMEILRQWESPDGPQLISKSAVDVSRRFPKPKKSWFGWEQGQKAYEMMSCYEGLLELYRITGKGEFKEAVERTWKSIEATEINIAGSGSAMECWFGGKELQTLPIAHYQETCVTATWIKLNQQLLRLTGKAQYADAIELAYYNALLGAMRPDGSDWAKYTPLSGVRLEGGEQCGMGINCCVASGPRGLFTLPSTAVMSERNGIRVNFYTAGAYHLTTPGGQSLQLVQQTDYPATGKVSILLLLPRKSEDFTLSLRIPAWSKQSRLLINGTRVDGVSPGEYIAVKRTWKSGDTVSLEMDFRGRVLTMDQQPGYMAIMRGPIVLARDARLNGPDISIPITPAVDKDGYIALQPVTGGISTVWMQFTAPFIRESHKEGANKPVLATLCDYRSAGNTVDDSSRFRVWLEQPLNPQK